MNFHIGDLRTNWEHIVNNVYTCISLRDAKR